MSGIYHHSIDTRINESSHTLHHVASDTDTCCYAQTATVVLACQRLVLGFGDILIGNQANQSAFDIDHRKFLDLVLLKDILCLGKSSTDSGRNKVLSGHHLGNLTIQVLLKTQVTIGDNTNEATIGTHYYGNATNMIFRHQGEDIANGSVRRCANGSVYHTVLGTLHLADLMRLSLNAHVLMDNADTAFTSHGNSHLGLGHCIHSSRDDRDIKRNIA